MIELLGNLYIRVDDKNFILCEKKVKGEGKNVGEEYFSDLGYYGKLEQALTGAHNTLLKRSINYVDLITLKDAISICRDLYKAIDNLVKGDFNE